MNVNFISFQRIWLLVILVTFDRAYENNRHLFLKETGLGTKLLRVGQPQTLQGKRAIPVTFHIGQENECQFHFKEFGCL